MGDVIFLSLVVAFFTLAAGFVRACERIIGPDEPVAGRAADPTPAPAVDPSEVRA